MTFPRFRLMLILVVAAIQALVVAGVLVVQSRVAERAMTRQSTEHLVAAGQRVNLELVRRVAPFRQEAAGLAERIDRRAFGAALDERGSQTELTLLLLGALTKSPDVATASIAGPDGSVFQLRRGGPNGFLMVVRSRGAVAAFSMRGRRGGAIRLVRQAPVDLPDVRTRPWYLGAVARGDVVLSTEADGRLIAAHRIVVRGFPAVVWLQSRPSVMDDVVRKQAPTRGGLVAVLPVGPDGSGWIAGGVAADPPPAAAVADLRAALGPLDAGGARIAPARVSGRDAVAAVEPFRFGDLRGVVVAVAPRADLTDGVGAIVRSPWLALGVGLLAGLLTLPLIGRATRSVDTMHRRATVDALTGVASRDEILMRGERALRRARGAGTRLSAGVLDLDGFKQVNDALGHAAGDDVLRALAERLRAAVRTGDMVGRLGGDEFVVVLGPRHDGDPRAVFERLREACAGEPFAVGGAPHRVDCTVGYAHDDGAGSVEDLIARADAALIAAKASGKGTVNEAPGPHVGDPLGSP